MSLGWTWDEVGEQMDFPRLKRLNRQWEKTPSLSVSVAGIAAFLGVKFTAAPGHGPGTAEHVASVNDAGAVLDMLIAEPDPR